MCVDDWAVLFVFVCILCLDFGAIASQHHCIKPGPFKTDNNDSDTRAQPERDASFSQHNIKQVRLVVIWRDISTNTASFNYSNTVSSAKSFGGQLDDSFFSRWYSLLL